MLSEKPWRIEAVIQLVMGVFICVCLGAVIGELLRQAGVTAFKSPESFGNLLLATLSSQGAAWLLIFIFLKQHKVRWDDALGLYDLNLKKTLFLTGGMLTVTMPLVWLIQYLSVTTLQKLGLPPEDQRAVEIIVNTKSIWLRAYFGFFAVVLAPVAEEFVFRGILYPLVKQLGSPRTAFLGISAIFAEIHFDAGTLVPLFVLALALTWLYEKTDNLLAPIAAHSLFNAVNFAVLCFVK